MQAQGGALARPPTSAHCPLTCPAPARRPCACSRPTLARSAANRFRLHETAADVLEEKLGGALPNRLPAPAAGSGSGAQQAAATPELCRG